MITAVGSMMRPIHGALVYRSKRGLQMNFVSPRGRESALDVWTGASGRGSLARSLISEISQSLERFVTAACLVEVRCQYLNKRRWREVRGCKAGAPAGLGCSCLAGCAAGAASSEGKVLAHGFTQPTGAQLFILRETT